MCYCQIYVIFCVLLCLNRNFAGGIGFFFVQVFAANRSVREHGHAVRLDFNNPAGHKHKLLATVGHLDAHRPRFDAGNQRRMAREDAEFAGLTRQGNKPRLAGKDRLFCADHINVDGVHTFPNQLGANLAVRLASAPQGLYIFLAFSNASSMVPTM